MNDQKDSTNKDTGNWKQRSGDNAFADLIESARTGDQQAIGELIEGCRKYLLLVANDQLTRDVQGKVGPSDIVQESIIAAQQQFAQFDGNSQKQLLAWLRGILINGTRDATRHFRGIQKRQVDREVKLHDTEGVPRPVADRFNTPSTEAVANEEAVLLEQAMSQLPEDYQQVLRLRNWEQQTFEQIALTMARSAEAVRKLWSRALLKLQAEFSTEKSGDNDEP